MLGWVIVLVFMIGVAWLAKDPALAALPLLIMGILKLIIMAGAPSIKLAAERRERFDNRTTALLELHKASLARRRLQLVQTDAYGVKDFSKWEKEREHFFVNVLRKDPEFESYYSKTEKSEITQSIYLRIDEIANQSQLSQFSENIEALSPLDFEHYCAEIMREAGWEDRVGKAITDLPSHTTVHTAPYTAVRHIQTSHAHALLSE